jgi:hypothetical protein
MPTSAPAGARTRVPSRNNVPAIVASLQLSANEQLAATITERSDGRRTAALIRCKQTADGLHHHAVFEFGEHRAQAIASLIDEILRALNKGTNG